jgi:ATP-dependent DNA helicase RecG
MKPEPVNTPWLAEAMHLLARGLAAGSFEGDRIEWKQIVPAGEQKPAKHLSAFANTPGGGFLVFGVANDGEVLGLGSAQADAIRNQIGGTARDGLEPPVRVEFALAPDPLLGTSQLLYVRIHEAAHPPVKLRGQSIENSYLRVGAASRRMSVDELADAFGRRRGAKSLLMVPTGLTGRAEELLDLPKAIALLNPSEDRTREGLLRAASEHGWIDLSGGEASPTKLGTLMTARDFRIVPGFERFGVRLIRYPSDTRVTVDGPAAEEFWCATGILFATETCVEFLKTAGPRIESLRGTLRREESAWPAASYREAVVNALVHRDYGRAEPVLIEAFRSRVEIVSPGGLLPTQTPARVLDRPPIARNPELYDAARLARLVEARGRGVDLMVSQAESARLPSPTLRDDGGTLKVVFDGPRSYDDLTIDERVWNVEMHVALAYEERRHATNTSLRERFGLAATPSNKVAVSRLLARCVDAGLVRPADPAARTRAVRYVPSYV